MASFGEPIVVRDDKTGLWYRPDTVDADVVRGVRVKFHFPIGPGDVLLDLGAHIGSEAVHAARLGVRVVAVEPEPKNLELLRLNTEEFGDLVTIVPAAAVSDHSLHATLWERPGRGTWTHSLFQRRGRVPVEVQTVDFAALLRMFQPTIVKANIEGSEYDLDWTALPPSVRALVVSFHQAYPELQQKAVKLRQYYLDNGWVEVKKPRVGVFAVCVTGTWVRPEEDR